MNGFFGWFYFSLARFRDFAFRRALPRINGKIRLLRTKWKIELAPWWKLKSIEICVKNYIVFISVKSTVYKTKHSAHSEHLRSTHRTKWSHSLWLSIRKWMNLFCFCIIISLARISLCLQFTFSFSWLLQWSNELFKCPPVSYVKINGHPWAFLVDSLQ